MNDRTWQRLFHDIELVRFGPEHVADVARLHYEELSWSFNGHLGPEHVRSMYASIVGNPRFFGYVIYHDGKLLGFVTATTNSAASRRSILVAYSGKLLRVLLIFARNPLFLVGALESLLVVPYFFRKFQTSAEWLTFVTNTRVPYLTPVVAIKLVDAVRDHFRAAGVGVYLAQGVKKNPKAMSFYEKLGWNVVARLPIHNIYVYRTDAPDASAVLMRKARR